MPISVTCQCGARLEIDEKFLGKEILCPDCQRPLPTKPAAVPPPLELPRHQRKSGLAILSLTLALVGAFLPPVSIAAIVVGIFALKAIAQKPAKLEGTGYARAGIIVGGVGLFLTLALMIYDFNADQLLRDLSMAGHIDYIPTDGDVFTDAEQKIKLSRPKPNPHQWARWIPSAGQRTNVDTDLLILVNTREDVYISCFDVFDVNVDDPEEKQKKVLEKFYRSELVNLLGHLRDAPMNRAATIEKSGKVDGGMWEVIADLRLGGINRRFLIQYPEADKHKLLVFVGAARRGRFDAVQADFREAFKNKK